MGDVWELAADMLEVGVAEDSIRKPSLDRRGEVEVDDDRVGGVMHVLLLLLTHASMILIGIIFHLEL